MKPLSFIKALTLVLSVASASLAFANEDGLGGGGGGFDFSSGGNSNFSFSSSNESPGGGSPLSFGSDSRTSNSGGDLLGSLNTLNNALSALGNSSESSSGSTGVGYISGPSLFSSSIQSPTWGNSSFNAENNPAVGVLLGTTALNTNSMSHQSFAALFVSRSPISLFLDLNGDGVRGDFIDGLLYNLFFDHAMDNRSYAVRSDSGTQATIREEKKRGIEELRKGLQNARIMLVVALSDGRTAAPLNEVISLAYDDKADPQDQEIAIASILSVATLEPAATSSLGPILVQEKMNGEVKTQASSMRSSLVNDELIHSLKFKDGGSRLAFEVSMNRLALVTSLIEQHITRRKGDISKIRPESFDAVRAALYFTAFELKRLKPADKNTTTTAVLSQDDVLKRIITALAIHAPQTLKAIGEKASNKEAIQRLQRTVIAKAPVLSQNSGGMGRAARYTTATLAAGVAVGAWMMGGDWAVESLTSDIALQAIGQPAGYLLSPAAMYFTNWWFKPSSSGIYSKEVEKIYFNMCNEALGQ